MENHELLKLECLHFSLCKTVIEMSIMEFQLRKDKFGSHYKPLCYPCITREYNGYRRHHPD